MTDCVQIFKVNLSELPEFPHPHASHYHVMRILQTGNSSQRNLLSLLY